MRVELSLIHILLYANILLSLYFGQKRLLKDLGKIKTFGHSLFI